MTDLNPRQQQFIQEYLIDLNATQAALRAGYSKARANRAGYELLQRQDVQDALAGAMEERGRRTEITADKVLCELGLLAFSNMLDYIRIDGGGETSVDLSTLTRDQAAAITEATIEESAQGRVRVKVKLADKNRALDTIGRHLGMFVQKHEHSGPAGGPIETNERSISNTELAQRILGLAVRGRTVGAGEGSSGGDWPVATDDRSEQPGDADAPGAGAGEPSR